MEPGPPSAGTVTEDARFSYEIEVPEGTYDLTAISWGNPNYPDVKIEDVQVHPDETTQVDIEFTWF